MIRVFLLIGFATTLSLGSQVVVFAQSATPELDVAALLNSVGKQCVVHLQGKTAKRSEEDSGTIVLVDAQAIVLSQATRTVRVEQTVPILGRLPFVSRYFRYVSIGREEVSGNLRIPLAEIASVDLVEQTPGATTR